MLRRRFARITGIKKKTPWGSNLQISLNLTYLWVMFAQRHSATKLFLNCVPRQLWCEKHVSRHRRDLNRFVAPQRYELQ